MKKMQDGMKHWQMGKQLVVVALMDIMVQFQELALNLVQMVIGILFLVLVMVLSPSLIKKSNLN